MRSEINSEDSESNKQSAIKIGRVPGKCEQKIRDFVGSRRGAIIISWSLSSFLILILGVCLAPVSEVAE